MRTRVFCSGGFAVQYARREKAARVTGAPPRALQLGNERWKTTVKDRIKAVRLALKLSQREFGERLGVSRDVISNLEYGRVQPKELLLRHICALYGVNETWLLRGEGPMFRGDPCANQRLDEALRLFKALRPEFQDYALEQIRQLIRLQDGGEEGQNSSR